MADEGQEKPTDSAETTGGLREHGEEDEWVVRAYRAYLHGEHNWSALGRELGHDGKTVKRRVEAYSQAVAEAYRTGGVDALAEYLDGAMQDLRDADRLVREGDQDSVKLGAVRARSEIRTKIAAARGIITERGQLNISGDLKHEHGADEDLTYLLARLVPGATTAGSGEAPAEPPTGGS